MKPPLDVASLLIVGRSPIGQWLERSSLDLDALAVPCVAPPDHLVDEATVGREILEVARAAQQENRPRFRTFSDSLYARARVNVNLELSRSGNGVRNGFRRPDGRGSGQFAESALDTLLCGGQ